MGMLSVGDSRLSRGGWTCRRSPDCVNPEPREVRDRRLVSMIWWGDGGMLTWTVMGNVLESVERASDGENCWESPDESLAGIAGLVAMLGTVVLLHLDFSTTPGTDSRVSSTGLS